MNDNKQSTTKTKSLFQLTSIGLLVMLTFSSCEENKSNVSDEQEEKYTVQVSEEVPVKKAINTREALERLQSYGILGSFENREKSNEIIGHYNRYVNGDESFNDFPYIVKILSLKGDAIPRSCIEAFIQEGADVNLLDFNGWTPLHKAIDRGYLEIIKLLLEYKADPNLADSNGCSPLHRATYSDHKIVKLLLEYKADPNVTDSDGWTPLHRVARLGSPENAKLLLEYKADPYLKNKDGQTPVDISRSDNFLIPPSKEVAELLNDL